MSAKEKLTLVEKVENIVLDVKGIKAVISNIGETGGAPALNGAGVDTPVDEIGRMNN